MNILIESWEKNKEELSRKTVNQLVGMCGDGKLKDGNKTSEEFREFLKIIPNKNIIKYTNDCLSSAADTSNKGLPLQDLVNETGARLEFDVTPGRYRGSSNKDTIGYDGLWKTKLSNKSIVIEIKTSSTYSIDLNIVGKYKEGLIKKGDCSEENSSILLVVGNDADNTDPWECQIRGSKRLWDTRIITVGGLLRLLEIKETIDDPEVFNKISNILAPKEYTKVDGIIDMVFSTAEDLKSDLLEIDGEEERKNDKTEKPKQLAAFNNECVKKIQSHLKVGLIKNTRTSYIDSKKEIIVMCLASKEYDNSKTSIGYWFGLHQHQIKTLSDSSYSRRYLALGCGSSELIILFPFQDFEAHLDKLNTTEGNGRKWYHIHVKKEEDKIYLLTKEDSEHIRIEQNKI